MVLPIALDDLELTTTDNILATVLGDERRHALAVLLKALWIVSMEIDN